MLMFSSSHRSEMFKAIKNVELDLLVIGGGITGAGISLDAVTRGMDVGVIEMQDFAAGTSSRSTKLVHGGLRYLKQFEMKMVAEVGKERSIVYENGPHVTTPEWMMLPLHKGGSFGRLSTNIGLRVYDFLAGVSKTERRKMLSREEAIDREPLVKQEGLKGAGYYVEYRTDDARLTLEVLKKAVEKGAKAINYAKVIGFVYEGDKVVGVEVEDQITGNHNQIYAKKIVNASGPWVDNLREMDNSKKGKTLHLTKGVHLVIDSQRFPLNQAIYFDTPDGRMVFAIPRDGKTYVGTTDTTYKGDIANPTMTSNDREYVINAINFMFPSVQITEKDIESSWAGLRPLIHEEGKDPSEISRKDEIFISKSGLISMAGGKLTGYRKMAANVNDMIVDRLSEETSKAFGESDTKHLPISGGDVNGSQGFEQFKIEKTELGIRLGLATKQAQSLVQLYGSNVDVVFNFYQENSEEANQFNIDRIVLAMLQYAIHHELCYKPVDFFIRRTGALFFNIEWVREHKETVHTYMESLLKWSKEDAELYMGELEKELYEAVTPVAEKK